MSMTNFTVSRTVLGMEMFDLWEIVDPVILENRN